MSTTNATDRQWRTMEREITTLIKALKKDIGDDYRADVDSETPSMCVTVSTRDGTSWSYQTGDNSYSGGCYGDPHWSVIYLSRRSNSASLAKEAVNELHDAVAELESYAAEAVSSDNATEAWHEKNGSLEEQCG